MTPRRVEGVHGCVMDLRRDKAACAFIALDVAPE
jgi:hypothetical protein